MVFYHLGLPPFSGGFIGVDVFFVISGFLITGLIAEDMAERRFKLARFYERRVRRILPALIAVLVFATIAATWRSLPRDFADFGGTMAATTIFGSNIAFMTGSGYFGAAAIGKPLLHTWSLAVEEQFYILYPLLLFGLFRTGRRRRIAALAVLAVLSFAGSIWAMDERPITAFYFAPFRAWELLLGALLALGAAPVPRTRRWREACGAAGLVLILGSAIAYDAVLAFPGWYALVPCIGAGLVLQAGAGGGDSWAARALRFPPLVFVGLISYSLYLWHWVLLVFFRYDYIGDMTASQRVTLLALSFCLAALSWKFVERPFRRRTGERGRRRVFLGAFAASLCLFVYGAAAYALEGWPWRFSPEVAQLASYATPSNPRQRECFLPKGAPLTPAEACTYGMAVPPRFALWGDSHADALIAGLGDIAARNNQGIRFFGRASCLPFVGLEIRVHNESRKCAAYNDAVMKTLEETPGIETVILAARYAAYLRGTTIDFGPAEEPEFTQFSDAQGHSVTVDSRNCAPTATGCAADAMIADAFRATVKRLRGAGKRVVLVYPIPEVGWNVPQTLAKLASRGIPPDRFTRPVAYFRARQQSAIDMLDSAGEGPEIVRAYPQRALCDPEACITAAVDKPLYSDDDHVSRAGGDYLAPEFATIFER